MKKKRNKSNKDRGKPTQQLSPEQRTEPDNSDAVFEVPYSNFESASSFIITGFSKGVLSGVLREKNLDTSQVELNVHGDCIGNVELSETPEIGVYDVSATIEGSVLEQGSNVFLLINTHTKDVLGRFNIKCGDSFEDVRQEVESLRAELDLLKRSFRTHVRGA